MPADLNVKPVDSKNVAAAIFLLEVEADEMWRFVGNKNNKQWIWTAIDVHTRQVIAFYVGSRDKDAARELWQKIPDAYKQHAEFYTDLYDAYVGVIPEKQYHRVSKQSDALQSH
ncbi:MAG: IS1 family transposase [Methylococcales bacterium]